jgi:phosphoribosyl-dephospho-CoA transferase
VADGEALPHDLVQPGWIAAVVADGVIPAWVRESLSRAPFVVVRRARSRADLLPVGVRGRARHERFAGWLPSHAVERRIRPEDLVRDEAWRFTARAAAVPHFALLDRLA